jgi:hypothetical protein
MSPKARFYVAAGLFLAWLGWLIYLVTQTRHPIILSRPQFLVADLYVTARVSAKDGKPAAEVTIDKTLWARDDKDRLPPGTQATVENLPKCAEAEQGWDGEGLYVLPLIKSEAKDRYRIAQIPLSPGFAADAAHRLRIYRATDEVLRQVDEIIATNK